MAGCNSAHGLSLPHHGMSLAQFDAMASERTDGGTSALLHHVERTRRLLALRLVLHHARHHHASQNPLPPVDEAWELLITAERADPEAVAALLSRPQVGLWLAHVLRRLRNKVTDTAPVWFHLGQLHLLAAAGGLSAKLRFAIPIPLWNGIGVLPGLGSVRVPEAAEWGHGTLVANATGLTVKTSDGTAHPVECEPIRLLGDEAGSVAPRIHLDDTGPYRGLEVPEHPDPLSESSATRWNKVFAEAWTILEQNHPHRARELSSGLSVITPRPAAHRFRPYSGSVGEGYGAAIISEPHDAAQLAVTMVHEYQHSKLNAISHLTPLVHEGPPATCYAPWRDDPRPVSGLYQGVNAFLAVAEFWVRQREHLSGSHAALAHFEFALVRTQVTEALHALRRHPSLTDLGRRFAARLAERLEPLDKAAVPAELRAAAEAAALDHRTAWRATHLHPVRAQVLECAQRWHAGEPAPPLETHSPVVAAATPPRLDAKAILTRILLAGRAELDALRFDPPGHVHKITEDVTEADFALVTGDYKRAHALYSTELTGGSDRPGAWSGFGIAVRELSPGPASRALLERPHLVRAVRRRIAATGETPDVERLAEWLGPVG
ncbi:HEXXH motif domain-containing protein [Saccharothrix luteola]|uniref:HEXXH motif domain-containing protein n=1 Tax=Saccharothrix luteola TaxID=2893018 RepID=UPI001E433693|nr:HEXXH motif domain-containing protein [Saccharothrix luteola]